MARNVHINVKEFIATLIGIWLEITTITISYAHKFFYVGINLQS